MDQMKESYRKFLKKRSISDETIEKSFYMLQVIFYEVLKFFFLLLGFWSIGEGGHFLLVTISIVPLRINVGGKHFSTQLTCFFASAVIFSSIIFLGKTCTVPYLLGAGIIVIACMVVYCLAPISSRQRPKYSPVQKRRFKRKGILFVICLYFLGFLLPGQRNYILWTIIVQTAEVLLVVVCRKGGSYHETGICTESQ